jgi:ATP-dependent DNA helicase RecG
LRAWSGSSPRPSREVIREVVANAVCHRHYGIAGPIQVRVFADRIEVQSPGGLPNGVSREAMHVGVSVRRNEFILQHLAGLGIVDAVGRGVVLMYEEAIELGLSEPEIVADDAWNRITLYLADAR